MRRSVDVVDIAAQHVGAPARGVAGHQPEAVVRVEVAEPIREVGEGYAEQPRHGIENLDVVIVLVAHVSGHAPVAVARTIGAGGDFGVAGVEPAVLAPGHLFGADVVDTGPQFAEAGETFARLVIILNVIAGPRAESALTQHHVTARLDVPLLLMQAHAIGAHLVLAGFDAYVARGGSPSALLIDLEFVCRDFEAIVARLFRQRHHAAALRPCAYRNHDTGRQADQPSHKEEVLHCRFAI